MQARPVALVTGGGGGIGSAIARSLAGAGALVFVAGRDLERLDAVADSIGGGATALAMDVTDASSIAAAVERAGRIDWLVNNAGFVASAPIKRLLSTPRDQDAYRKHMDVNFHGARAVFEACLPGMLERGHGRVVQIASSAALQGYAYVSAYAASKHALLGYTRSAALELAGSGVALSALCPHYVDSPMTDASVAAISGSTGQDEAEVRRFLAAQNPGGVLIAPDEVAAATLELIEGERTGVVRELIGGASRTVDEGTALTLGTQ